ncbi:MAG: serine hydrolase, partial [Oscillospiraceae bacterium]
MQKIPQQKICELLSTVNGTFGIYVKNIDSDETFTVNADVVFPAASIIKIPLLAFLLKKVEDGSIDWNAPVDIAASNRVGGTGILAQLDESYSPSVKSLALLMITLSDNTATNQIIDMVGMEEFHTFCLELGYKDTILMRKMLDFEGIKAGKNNYTTVNEMGDLLCKVCQSTLVSPWVSAQIFEILSKQQCRNKLPAFIPAVPSWASQQDRENLKPNTVLVANKTGDLTCIQHDVGIFTLPNKSKYIIAAFSS